MSLLAGPIPDNSTTLEKSIWACRLLDRSIRMLFEGEDALYVMTMAHPAHLILQNLAERALAEKNGTRLVWESLRNEGYVLMEDGSSIETYNEFLTVLHKAPNAAKHANRPAETHATYGPGDAAAIMASACIHASRETTAAFGQSCATHAVRHCILNKQWGRTQLQAYFAT